jgi:orotate phosphoribosyltransferase-like protein
MKEDDVKNRFVELPAKNWSYKRIADELNVSKQPRDQLEQELSHAIANLRTIEFEELQAKHRTLREKRIELFGNILNQLSLELGKRASPLVGSSRPLGGSERPQARLGYPPLAIFKAGANL